MSIQSRTCGRYSETSSWRCKQRTTVPMKPERISGAVDPPWMTMVITRAINTKKGNYNLMTGTDTAEAVSK